MENFYDKMQNVIDDTSVTENGMVGYNTTNHKLVDIFFKIASYRSNATDVLSDYKKLLDEKEPYALKFLFYARDVREGLGEREYFRKVLSYLVKEDYLDSSIISLIPEYGRYDDLFVLMGTKLECYLIEFIYKQLKEDLANLKENKPISLLAKWMPSENTSSKETTYLAKNLISKLHYSPKEYRKTLSKLRKYLDVVECKMSSKDWKEIDYNKVPSKANLNYNSAFLRNDEDRRRDYLNKLIKGDKNVHINASVLYPHEIVAKYVSCYGQGTYNETFEQLWNNLKPCDGLKDTIVVRDGSGSMTSTIGGTNVTAISISTALAIYCSQYLSKDFKDKFITFSEKPKLIDLSLTVPSLHAKLKKVYAEDECANTNIEAVFDLILKTAISGKTPKEDMPKQILIISDMEFDYGVTNSDGIDTLLENEVKKYNKYGYDMPKLAFWNVNSRTNTIPIKNNKNGLIFISGFSTNVLKMVMNRETDSYKALIKELNKDRYAKIKLL